MEYIIVKYADEYYPNGVAPFDQNVSMTFSARECGVEKESYPTPELAAIDYEKLKEFNPTANYGIVRAV